MDGRPEDNACLLEPEAWSQVRSCYQCGRCAGGCPLAFAMDRTPRALMRLLQLGLVREALSSDTIWLCAGCYSCSVGCPRGIDLAGLMYHLRQKAVALGVINESVWFYRVFVEQIAKRGVIHEPGLMLAYARRVGIRVLVPHVPLALEMLRRGNLTWKARRVADRDNLAWLASEVLTPGGWSA